MKELEERIRRDGTVKTGDVLKVDAFLNHQCDVRLFDHMGQEWARHFAGKTITKILTIEASGIGIACCAARHFGDVPVVFAKKAQSINLDGEQYATTIYSFTKQKEYPVIVGKRFLSEGDKVLIIDDFLANGCALEGLIKICEAAGAEVAGIGIAEKGYADYKITVRSKGGHSSQPPVHSGIGEIAKVTRDLEGHQFKAKMPHFVYALFTKIGKRVSYPARIVTCNLWLLKPIVTLVMKKFPPAASLIRTTTGVSMAEGSPAANVLPQKSSITVNFRMMPGTTLADVKEHIKKVVKKKDIEIELLKGKEASKVSPTDSRSFKILEELCMRTDNNYIVAPYLVMGGTDSYHYENICDCIYRFAPFEVDTKYLLLTHATNERIPVDCMEGALKFFKRYIKYMSKE